MQTLSELIALSSGADEFRNRRDLGAVTANPLMAAKFARLAEGRQKVGKDITGGELSLADMVKMLLSQDFPKPADTFNEMLQAWKDDPSRRLNQVLGVAGMAPLAATVFHGSPHQFTKFDASKIGTGEGAQAYGHGLYLAENPKVAREYTSDNPVSMFPRKGPVYKVDLPDEQIAKMLDWDKPLSQQPEVVKRLQSLPEFRGRIDSADNLVTGQHILAELSNKKGGADKASTYLREAGIPGIRYLDQGSRATGKGTHNYVVFPGGEDLLKILGRE